MHRLGRFPHTEPAQGHAIERHLGNLGHVTRAQAEVRAPLHDAEAQLPGRRRGGQATLRPASGALHRLAQHFAGGV